MTTGGTTIFRPRVRHPDIAGHPRTPGRRRLRRLRRGPAALRGLRVWLSGLFADKGCAAMRLPARYRLDNKSLLSFEAAGSCS